MKLSEWVWLGAGVLIALVSGYIYLFVPKNGQPNSAMALFFFIGIVFIVIGITKLFFKRQDDKSVLDSIKEEELPQKTITMPIIESKPNRIDEEINQMLHQKSQEISKTQDMHTHHAHIQQTISQQNINRLNHSNSFSQTHQYSGPVKTSVGSPNAQHPVAQHTAQQATHPMSHMQHHPEATHTSNTSSSHIQNTTEHSIKCGKCSNVNPGHSNYCHKCGNRLK